MKLLFPLCTMLLFFNLQAQQINKAGTLDNSFGTKGTVLTSSPTSYLQSAAVAAQSDGSIIAVGNTSSNDSAGFFAIKYSLDGVIDPTFGVNGLAYFENAGWALAIAIQQDNKILIAGYYAELFGPYNVSIVRFNADGIVDSTFGENGLVLSSLGDRATAVMVQPDGKILIEGGHKEKALTMRYLPDGTLDKTFGSNGIVETDFGIGGTSLGYAIAVQPDGKIVVGGQERSSPFLGRYNTDGTLDESFGSEGKAIYNMSNAANLNDLVLQKDGKIVAVGTIASMLNDTVNSIIFRCMPDGTLDPGFATTGINEHAFKTKSALRSVVLQKDGKIVTCGSISDITGTIVHFLLERYTINGVLDSSFAANGYQTTTLDTSDVAYSVFLQGSDEKIVLGGAGTNRYKSSPLEAAIALARYNNDVSKKQIITTKIKKWLQQHNGFIWDNNNNINNYAVQRSYDGIHFSSIARIDANNQPGYSYADPSPLSGTNYYRLQTTSTSGAVAYSNVIAVTGEALHVSIAPNPAKNSLHIEGLPLNQKIKVSVVDYAGHENLQAVINNTSCNLNIASLKAGNYVVKMEMNEEVITKKFVKE